MAVKMEKEAKQYIHNTVVRSLHTPTVSHSTLGHRAFSVAVPTAWNTLPDDLRDPSLSADIFRKRLKTHLFRNALGHVVH